MMGIYFAKFASENAGITKYQHQNFWEYSGQAVEDVGD